MSNSWLETRFAHVGKSGAARTVTSMPIFFSAGFTYSAGALMPDQP